MRNEVMYISVYKLRRTWRGSHIVHSVFRHINMHEERIQLAGRAAVPVTM